MELHYWAGWNDTSRKFLIALFHNVSNQQRSSPPPFDEWGDPQRTAIGSSTTWKGGRFPRKAVRRSHARYGVTRRDSFHFGEPFFLNEVRVGRKLAELDCGTSFEYWLRMVLHIGPSGCADLG